MRKTRLRTARHLWALAALALLVLASCGTQQSPEVLGASAERPVVVATTSILGDVVENLAAGQFEVVTVMPAGTDPHHFRPSAQDIAMIENASAVVSNGASFESGLLDVLHAAESGGAPVFEAISAIDPLIFSGAGLNSEALVDPHFFTDPSRMAIAASEITEFLMANLDTIDGEVFAASSAEYIKTLTSLDAEVEATLATVPESRRVLITNHHVFGYFADRYDFDVIGTVVPVGSANGGVSGRRLADLAALLGGEGASVIFADTSSSDELAQTLAAEVGDVPVVKLYSESLGEPGSNGATYVDMVRNNALEIASALGN